jgi:hypothetical protein
MVLKPSKHLPELGDYTDGEMQTHGYTRRAISVFDHVLTEAEADACELFTYNQAIAHGLKRTYLEQESRFIAFYKDLFAEGVIRTTLVGRQAIGTVLHLRWDRKLKAAVVRSLRERRLMDAYAPSFKLRVLGGYDRTDQILFEAGAPQDPVEELATAHGLFLWRR